MKRPSILFLLSVGVAINSHAETLEEAVLYALKTNPNVLIATSQLLASNQALIQAKADYYPRLDLIGSVAREHSRNPRLDDFPNAPNSNFTSSEAKVAAIQNIFEGFRTVNEVSKNRALVSANAFKVDSSAQDIALEVSEAYLDVIRQQRLVKLAKQNLSAHDGTFKMIHSRRKNGLSDDADLTQASGRLALAHTDLVKEEKNLESAKIKYLQVVGKLPEDLTMPHIDSQYLPKDQQEIIALALENNPFLKSARDEVIAAQKLHEASNASNYPVLDIELSAGRNKNINGVAGSFDDDVARLSGYYNLYRGGGDLARQRETAYLVQAAWENKNLAERDIRQDAQQSWIDYTSAREQIPYLKQHKVASKESSVLYQKQFKIGQRTLLDVLDSNNEYYYSSIAYVNGLFAELVSQYKILNNLGILTQSLAINLPKDVNLS